MPPKKKKAKRRKKSQPLQKQSQKQIVNIKIGDDKKRRRRRTYKRSPTGVGVKGVTPLTQQQGALQLLGSNLNMLSSDTARLNNLENVINALRRENEIKITTGRPKVMQTSSQTNEVVTPLVIPLPPPPQNTPLAERKKLDEDFLIPLRDDYMRDIETGNFKLKEIGDMADLLNPTKRATLPPTGEKETLKKVKKKLRKRLVIKEKESAEKPRSNVSSEPFETGGVDIPDLKVSPQKMEEIQGLAGLVSLTSIENVMKNLYKPQEETAPEPILTSGRKPRADKGIKKGKNIIGRLNETADEFRRKRQLQNAMKNLRREYLELDSDTEDIIRRRGKEFVPTSMGGSAVLGEDFI